jgi:hypothetical protein
VAITSVVAERATNKKVCWAPRQRGSVVRTSACVPHRGCARGAGAVLGVRTGLRWVLGPGRHPTSGCTGAGAAERVRCIQCRGAGPVNLGVGRLAVVVTAFSIMTLLLSINGKESSPACSAFYFGS